MFRWLCEPPRASWVTDCLHWHRRVLTGPYAHWCDAWDELPIDFYCPEICSCLCYRSWWFRHVVAPLARWCHEY